MWGGAALVLTPEAATRFNSFSDDPTGLGRWTSSLINGRDGWNLRIVAAYNPCKRGGNDTVWSQHQRYFRSLGNFTDPIKMMEKDLCVALSSWLASDEHIVLMIDANQCVRTGDLGKAFAAMGINEAIISKHITMQPPPATHMRGSRPIDGIFTTLDPATFTSGYLPFGEGLDSDHRTAWIDIPFSAALGHNPPHLNKMDPSPLTLFDPAIEAKYHKEVTKAYESQKVFSNIDRLCRMVEDGAPLEEIIPLYDDIALLCRRIRKKVEATLRKLKMGSVQWSPTIQRLMDERKLWTNVVKWNKCLNISHKKIKRQMLALHILDALDISLEEAQARRDLAQKEWLKAVKDAPNLRKEWLQSLAKRRAARNGTTEESELKMMRHRELQRESARRRRAITGKGADRAKTTRMYYSQIDPVTGAVTAKVECNTQDDMGTAGVRENDTRMNRAHVSSFSRQPLYADFGDLADTPAAAAVLEGAYEPPKGTDPYVQMLLSEMRIPHQRPKKCGWPTIVHF